MSYMYSFLLLLILSILDQSRAGYRLKTSGYTCDYWSSIDAGYSAITTESACISAASSMGYTYGYSLTSSTYPEDCFYYPTNGKVYFNYYDQSGDTCTSTYNCVCSFTADTPSPVVSPYTPSYPTCPTNPTCYSPTTPTTTTTTTSGSSGSPKAATGIGLAILAGVVFVCAFIYNKCTGKSDTEAYNAAKDASGTVTANALNSQL